MVSGDLHKRIENAKRDLVAATNGPNFRQISNSGALMPLYSEAQALKEKWLNKVEPKLVALDDSAVQPLVVFMEEFVRIVDQRPLRTGEAIPLAFMKAMSEFKSTLPLLIYGLLEASGITSLSDENIPERRAEALTTIDLAAVEASIGINNVASKATDDFKAKVDEAITGIRKTVEDAEKDLELVKTQASRISVESAQAQFDDAARSLRNKAGWWSALTAALFVGLFGLLGWLLSHPPQLVRDIVDALKPGSKAVPLPVSVPLLIVASAYFTSIRLAIIGILGIGLAFSLRMTRAYLHMIEHNRHKLRVTNSIEAFVAAVRTNEQKDLVLSKLVESVTEFGDSGILGKQGEASSLPSVVFETMTKNIGKAE